MKQKDKVALSLGHGSYPPQMLSYSSHLSEQWSIKSANQTDTFCKADPF